VTGPQSAVRSPQASDQADQLIGRVQELQTQVEALDPIARGIAEELVSAVVQMYGAGLERIVAAAGDSPLRDELVADPVVASLLLIHDLYPVPVEERVAEALERVRPYMESHGGDVELLAVRDGIAHLRLQGSCRSCAASSATLELAVRQALEEAAPDLEGMEVDGVMEQEPPPEPLGVALPMAAPPAWFDLDGVAGVAPEEFVGAQVAGTPLVVANVAGTLLAYRDRCASCGGELHSGELSDGALTCPGCGRSYYLPRAGRSLDDERIQLDPVPLLRDNGSVRVALSQ
jgi:Fe-S cluster biogenesis protein NfuA/nitrite reductase/ring-hydroxylating ferredoxin subunit